MIPKRVVMDNFLSFGSPATEIVFGDDEPLWVLGGPNGVGKSAVFDAITYALFGCHRGGGQNADQLVRHGANGFRVVFDFEFNRTDYRITRSRTGRTTQKVERRNNNTGGWEPVANVNSAADVKAWAERTLGLGFDAFTASVLLRQGEADAIITAGGTDRLKILKKIIGVERYEALSDRVHAATREREGELKRLHDWRDKLTQVTDAEVEAAKKELLLKQTDRSTAQDAATVAAGRVPQAKQWVTLETERKRLEEQITAARERADKADRIRTEYTRLNDLQAAEQVLQHVVTLRGRLSDAPDTLRKLRDKERRLADDLDRLTAAAEQERQKEENHRRREEEHTQEAKTLRKELQQTEKLLPTTDEIVTLRDNLARFPPDLEGQLHDARGKLKVANGVLTSAGQAKANVAGLLEQAVERQRRFDTVEVGVQCSLCGQAVSEDHARDEVRRLAAEVQRLENQFRAAEGNENKAAEGKELAETERERLDALIRQHREQSQRLAGLEKALAGFGVTADAAELRKQIDLKQAAADSHDQQARTAAAARKSAAGEAERLDKERQATAQRLLEAVATEWQRLTKAGIAGDYQKLEQDAVLVREWVKRLGEVTGGIGEIPKECRTSVADAEQQVQQMRQAAREADKAWQDAKATADKLTRQAAEYHEVVGKLAGAERQADLHRKLDGWLGKGGLQRELVRTAEREIVRLANDTVQNLSNGDLAIELDDGADGNDEAFSLRVRRAESPMPIAVSFLSGSQKFRVAIAVALAIGRFAAGQARPLESVIIDEGFGSLDRDGLQAAAEELNRLRQHLRRIVLVSHQEEFADRFPVVIRLTAGESGTTAEAMRR
jgi:DNA repair exonuclease SbcCD ATPase subunit